MPEKPTSKGKKGETTADKRKKDDEATTEDEGEKEEIPAAPKLIRRNDSSTDVTEGVTLASLQLAQKQTAQTVAEPSTTPLAVSSTQSSSLSRSQRVPKPSTHSSLPPPESKAEQVRRVRKRKKPDKLEQDRRHAPEDEEPQELVARDYDVEQPAVESVHEEGESVNPFQQETEEQRVEWAIQHFHDDETVDGEDVERPGPLMALPLPDEPAQAEEIEPEVVQHWNNPAQDVDPLPAWAQVFRQPADFTDAQRAAIAEEIRDTARATFNQITELDRSLREGYMVRGIEHCLEVQPLDAFIMWLIRLRRLPAAMVRAEYAEVVHHRRLMAHYRRPGEPEEAAPLLRDYVYGNPREADLILIPRINMHLPPGVVDDISQIVGHFTLGVYNPRTGAVMHYDPIQPDAIHEDVRDYYHNIVRNLHQEGEEEFRAPRVIPRPPERYNRQNDGNTCGWRIALLANLILERGIDRTYVPNFGYDQMQAERVRIGGILRELIRPSEGNQRPRIPEYRPPLRSQRLAPPRERTASTVPTSRPTPAPTVVTGPSQAPGDSDEEELDPQSALPTNRRMVCFGENDTVQFVAEPPELRRRTTQCYRTHTNLGCFAGGARHLITEHKLSSFDGDQCPYCKAWLTKYEVRRGRRGRIACKGCYDGRVHTAAMEELYNLYMRGWPSCLRGDVASYLLEPRSRLFRHFQKRSKNYNSLNAFGAHGCGEQVVPDAPWIGTLNRALNMTLSDVLPANPNRPPAFGSLYSMSLDEAIDALQSNPNERVQTALAGVNMDLFRQLRAEIASEHRLAPYYRHAGGILRRYQEEHNGDLPRYRYIIKNLQRGQVHTQHGNPATDVPTNETEVLFWHDPTGDQDAPPNPGIWLCGQGNFVQIDQRSPHAMPILFPAIFGTGEPWFRPGLVPSGISNEQAQALYAQQSHHSDDDDDDDEDSELGEDADDPMAEEIINDELVEHPTNRRGRRGDVISVREFTLYHLWRRPYVNAQGQLIGVSFLKSQNCFLDMGVLTQQFINIAGAQVKAWQAEGLKRHQEEEMRMRTALSEEHQTYMERIINRQHPGAKLGKFLYVPKEVAGSRRYYQQKYTNLLALKAELGRNPDLFLTVTMDITKPEIKAMFPPGVSPLDRPDIIVRVWEELWDKIVKDVMGGKMKKDRKTGRRFYRGCFGEVVAVAIVREHQGRGAPHAHLIIWLADFEGKGSAEWIDQYISAEFPDPPHPEDASPEAEQQRHLCELVARLMIHRHTETSTCMVNNRCKRYYPKSFSSETILAQHRFPQYQRRMPPPDEFLRDERQESEDLLRVNDVQDQEDDDPLVYRRRPPVRENPHEIPPPQRHLYGNTVREEFVHGTNRRLRAPREYDNRYVVPYNAAMLLEYGCHVCLEYVGSSSVFHYLCDYCCKGAPLVTVSVVPERGAGQEQQVVDWDEFTHEARMTYTTATQMLADLAQTPLFRILGGWSIHQLYVTMPGKQKVIFPDGDPARARLISNPLQAYFELNARLSQAGDNSASELTFATVSKYYVFKRGQWRIRVKPDLKRITRIGRVADHDTEAQSLRMLLHHVAAPTCYNDLKRLPGDIFNVHENEIAERSFTNAARRRGLIQGPEIWIQTLREAFQEIQADHRKCRFFAVLIFNSMPRDVPLIFDTLLDDVGNVPLIGIPPDQRPADSRPRRLQRALQLIEFFLRNNFNSSCAHLGLPEPEGYDHAVMQHEEEQAEDADAEAGGYQGNPDRQAGQPGYWQRMLADALALLTEEQLNIFNTVIHFIRSARDDPDELGTQRLFMIEGLGGVGKTELNKAFIAQCMLDDVEAAAENRRLIKPLSTASTGIASNHLPRGTTFHRALSIPRNVEPNTQSRMNPRSSVADVLRACYLLDVDEMSMLHRDVFEYADRMLRDLWPADNARVLMPFGGVPIVATGNWAQLKPVVPRGGEAASRNASIKMSPLFGHFRVFRLTRNMRVGPGQQGYAELLAKWAHGQNYVDLANQYVVIPDRLRVYSAQQLIDFSFPPDLIAQAHNVGDENRAGLDELRKGVILAPHRTTVARINEQILNRIQGDWVVRDSFDHPVNPDNDRDYPRGADDDRAFALERDANDIIFLNTQHPSGFPPHRLRLKVGAICVVLCNYEPSAGLNNGTRVQLIGFPGPNLIRARILDGRNRDQVVLIGRAQFEYGRSPNERGPPFIREQFPLEPGFVLTIHKAQGMTLQRCGAWLHDGQCFGGGMFYTMMSRATGWDAVRVYNSLGHLAVNPVDYQLLGVQPQIAAPDLAPPIGGTGVIVDPVAAGVDRGRGDGRPLGAPGDRGRVIIPGRGRGTQGNDRGGAPTPGVFGRFYEPGRRAGGNDRGRAPIPGVFGRFYEPGRGRGARGNDRGGRG